MKRITLITLLSFFTLSIIYAQTFEWAKSMGGSMDDWGYSIAIDDFGNIYTTGIFKGTADFDPGSGIYNLTSAGSHDIFIQKLDANGNFIWAKRMGGSSSDIGYFITIDGYGNIYTTGYFISTVDFDPGSGIYNLTSAGFADIFIQKLDANGNFIWAKGMGGSSNDIGHSITIDGYGNIYTTGNLSTGSYNVFIQKLDANGNFIWAKGTGGGGPDEGNSIAIDGSGNIYTTGYFFSTVDFDPGSGTYNLTSAGLNDIFIQKWDANGNFIWAKRMGGSGYDIGKFIAFDSPKNIYTTGYFNDTVDFDPGSGIYNLISAGGGDVFIQKLDSNGNFIWAKGMGGSNYDQGLSIATDDSGNVYSTGQFGGTVDFDPGSGIYNLTSAGSRDIFIQKLDANGNFIWAKRMGGSCSEYGGSIAINDSGNIYTIGTFECIADFDPGSGIYNLTSAGSDDIFIQKLSQNQVSFTTSKLNLTMKLQRFRKKQ